MPRPIPTKVLDRVKSIVPAADVWHTGGGCTAIRIDCGAGGYLMITEHDGAHVPPDDATVVDVCRYGADGEPIDEGWGDYPLDCPFADAEGAVGLPVGRLTEWILKALVRGGAV